MKNKKGFAGILIFVIALLLIIMIGFIASIAVGLFDYVGDEVTPLFADLGVIGDTNFTELAGYTTTPANTFVQALPWLAGFGYVAMIIFSIIFVVTYTTNPHPAFIGAYILFIILIVFGAIIMSNMYEDIYTGTDELGSRLREQTALSYMILYSPGIMVLIAIIAGIYIFARPPDAQGGFI